MSDVDRDRISGWIDAYNDNICKESKKKEEIQALKSRIQSLEIECSKLQEERQCHVANAQGEVYRTYNEKDLLKMASKIERITHKEMAGDFRELVNKFSKHEMEINDIAQLNTYCKIYGSYVRKDNVFIKSIFKALGGGTLND